MAPILKMRGQGHGGCAKFPEPACRDRGGGAGPPALPGRRFGQRSDAAGAGADHRSQLQPGKGDFMARALWSGSISFGLVNVPVR
ncbi:MAG: hypothetical protein ABJA82_10600, partial [Myxococcales bacterium]